VHGGVYQTFTNIPLFVCAFDANESEGGKDVSNYFVGVHLFTIVE
jgi:hypothetical protein